MTGEVPDPRLLDVVGAGRFLDKDELRAALPLGRAALELGIRLDEGGTALCPWHDDRHPSFHLYEGSDGVERFACAPCGITGDCFDLIMRVEGTSFPEALARARELLQGGGGTASRPRPRQPFDSHEAGIFLEMSWARARQNLGYVSVSLGLLGEGAPATVRQTCDRWLDGWGVGIGPDGEAVLPHWDVNRTLAGLKLRGIDGSKWSAPGSSFAALYGSWRQRQHRSVLLCEGETDALWASLALSGGVADVLALPSGAQKFEEAWAALRAETYWLAFDGDADGRHADTTWRERLVGRDVRTLPVPDGLDLKQWQPDLKQHLLG